MHNLPTRTILNVGISCFTNFPVVTERKIMRCLPKESQSKRTKSHRYHNCQRLPSCFRRITRKSRLRATGTDILCHVTQETVLFFGRLRKSKANVLSKERAIIFFEGGDEIFGGNKQFFSGSLSTQTIFFPTASLCKQITCALPSQHPEIHPIASSRFLLSALREY